VSVSDLYIPRVCLHIWLTHWFLEVRKDFQANRKVFREKTRCAEFLSEARKEQRFFAKSKGAMILAMCSFHNLQLFTNQDE